MSTPEIPSVNFFSLFRRGQHYAKTWPMEKRLAPMFIENRTIRATRYAIRFMPRSLSLLFAGKLRWVDSLDLPSRRRSLR